MSDNAKWSDIGNEIRSAVNDSLHTGDFTKLGDCLTDTVTQALGSIFGYQPTDSRGSGYSSSSSKASDGKDNNSDGSAPVKKYYVPKEETFTEKWIRENRAKKQEEAKRQYELEKSRPLQGTVVKAPFNRIGSVSGVLFSVFGGIGIGLGIIGTLAFELVEGLTGVGLFNIGVRGSAVVLAASILMLFAGKFKRSNLAKAEKYYKICSKKGYCNIEDIALQMNVTVKKALKEIKKLLRKGFFPQGHLSREKDCLMLDDSIYNEYLSVDKQRRLIQSEMDSKKQIEKSIPDVESKPDSEDNELDVMIAEGESCIAKLRMMNENIPGEEISLKLYRLENLLKEIFYRLKEHPEQKGQMHKFMNYYLPMTLKLVGAYEEFDSLSVQGNDIIEAKREIEKTLDTINDAFGELLTRLFKDAAFDASTDAQVLKTMLAKEGLTKDKSLKFNPDGSNTSNN